MLCTYTVFIIQYLCSRFLLLHTILLLPHLVITVSYTKAIVKHSLWYRAVTSSCFFRLPKSVQGFCIHRPPECLSLRRNWVPLTPASECVSLLGPDPEGGGGNTRLRVKGWGDPITTNGQTPWYSVYCSLYLRVTRTQQIKIGLCRYKESMTLRLYVLIARSQKALCVEVLENQILRGMERYAKVCQRMPRYAKECQGMPRNAKECRGMPRNAKECQDMPKNAKVYAKVWKYS